MALRTKLKCGRLALHIGEPPMHTGRLSMARGFNTGLCMIYINFTGLPKVAESPGRSKFDQSFSLAARGNARDALRPVGVSVACSVARFQKS